MILIDTDIIIWNMRGHQRAADFLAGNLGFSISAVTYMELLQGLRNQAELKLLRQALHQWQAQIINLDQRISSRASFMVETYCLSHGQQMGDALISATAIEHNLPLASANIKHFQFLDDLTLIEFKP